MTSSSTLGRLLTKLKVPDFEIIRKKDFPRSGAENVVINLDDNGKGTHWVFCSKKHKLYFDSYGQPPPLEIPKDYRYSKKIIEGINQTDCGQLCCLACYYINKDGNLDNFYKLFKSLYN